MVLQKINITFLPTRQKVLLITTIGIWVYILYYLLHAKQASEGVNIFVFSYGLGMPLIFLLSSIIIDLNNNKIFIMWFSIAMLQFVASFCMSRNPLFLINRAPDFNSSVGVNSWLSKHSVSSLKSLFIFLIAYWGLNNLSKRFTGDCMVNTFKLKSWYNDDAKRSVNWWDIFGNIALFIIIFAASLFGN